MAFEGTVWNEAVPTNSTVANEIDDYMRDLRSGVRSRMAIEHIWPSSQTSTSEAGQHKYITLSVQTGAPTIPSTQAGIIYMSSGVGLIFTTSGGGSNTLVSTGGYKNTRAAVWYVEGAVATGTKQSATLRMPVGGAFISGYAYLDASNTGAAMVIDINKNGSSIFATTAANMLIIADGSTGGACGAISTATFTAGDLVTIDVDTVGSVVAGTDLSIALNFVEV